MRTKQFILGIILAFILIGFINSNLNAQVKSDPGQLKVLELTGSAYECGFQHGKALKNEIKTIITKWKNEEQKRYNRNIDSLLFEFLDSTSLYDAVKRNTPELLDEIKGISDGSGIDLRLIMAFQVSEEFGTFGKDFFSHHCTSLGFAKNTNHPTIIAQNLDVPTFLHGCPVLLHIKDKTTDLEQYIYTFPGHIGANGLNNKGLGLTINAIYQVNHSTKGLPVAFVIRGFLRKTKFKDGEEFIHKINHSTGQNYLIGGVNQVASLECSSNQVANYKPFDNINFTYHTNHPLKNTDISDEFKESLMKKGKVYNSSYKFKCTRFDYLVEKINDNYANVDSIVSVLSVRKNYINNGMNYGCCIMILSENPELHIAAGRPDEIKFQIFKFKK